ncbi:MAG: hypothetical protein LKE41_03635 [Prevotella sp.]|jgi:hypothetical protein|nr:hypothetical protein [Prevotella sp.]
MTIEESDFRLSPSSNTASDFWDLELLVTVKATKKEENSVPKQKFKNVGYGLPLVSAVKRICNYRIQHKHRGKIRRKIRLLLICVINSVNTQMRNG